MWGYDHANRLMHHGIKGMQWGVRHGPPYPINKDDHNTMIRKGTKISRLSVHDERVSEGHAYVTYLKTDTQHYKGFFGARLRAINKGKNVYSISMTAKKDLLSPSKKQRVDTFMELYEGDTAFRKELGRYHKSDYHYYTPLPKKYYEYKFSRLKDDKVKDVGYDTFVRSIGGNEYTRSAYFKALSKKGFDFVMDDQDAGRFGKAPAIILDRNRSVDYVNQVALDNSEIRKAWRSQGTYINKTKPNEIVKKGKMFMGSR